MKNKDAKARMQIIFGVLLFTLILTAELYTMMNYPGWYIVIAVLAVVDLVCLYVVVNGMMIIQEQKNIRREEQYDSIFKSQKASYLMLKKYFEEIEDKLNYLEAASKVPTEEIVNAQKGIAKVIINRGHENTQALMSSYEMVMEELNQFKERVSAITDAMDANRDEVLASQKNAEDINEKTLQLKLQDITVAMKDMELRLNNAIMQSQKTIAQTIPVVQAPVQMESAPTEVSQSKQGVQEERSAADEFPGPEPEAVMEPELEIEAESEIELELESQLEPSIELESGLESELEPAAIELESEVEPELSIGLEQENEPEIEAESENEPNLDIKEESAAEIEPEPIQDPDLQIAEDTPPMPDLSDPNKALNPDEIAALFANMSGDVGAKIELEAEPEPEEEPAPMPDLSDPNKALSPDEIAALFASMGS